MIKVKDIAFVRFSAPDLEQMERFLLDFGLMVTARENDVIYARRTDPSPYLHVTERGEHGFRGVAFASPIPTVTPSRWCTDARRSRRCRFAPRRPATAAAIDRASGRCSGCRRAHRVRSVLATRWCVSQIFADDDLLNDQNATTLHGVAAALGTQWGEFAP